jgi:2',3'-cyclic-nucleotide 2'-phosphodiesterase (5'-nucleotidase family)
LLSVNDTYRAEGDTSADQGGLHRLRALRRRLEAERPDLLVLHAGDLLFPSFQSRSFAGEQMIAAMNLLDGDPSAFDPRLFFVPGNHEFDQPDLEGARALDANLERSQFTWLSSNLRYAVDRDGLPLLDGEALVERRVVESGGLRIGLFGLSIGREGAAAIAEQRDTFQTARVVTASLRAEGAEFVVALTHQPLEEDRRLLETLGAQGPDLIVGGHEHSRHLVEVEGRLIVKADADAASAALVKVVRPAGGPPRASAEHLRLAQQDPEPDPDMVALIGDWSARHAERYCREKVRPPQGSGCLDNVFGVTRTELVGEELEIRRYETNLGGWVADQALVAMKGKGAQFAFVNSGALRLNRNIPAGADITRQVMEELFAYPAPLRTVKISGRELRELLAHSVSDWTGSGHFLQVAGLAFRFDPQSGAISELHRQTTSGLVPVHDTDQLIGATVQFLVDPALGDQDGYGAWLSPARVGQEGPDLKQICIDRIYANKTMGPELEGRICNLGRPGPCLLDLPPGAPAP